KRKAFIEHRVDLAVELPHRPSSTMGFFLIEVTLSLFLQGEQSHVMRPRQHKTFGRRLVSWSVGEGRRLLNRCLENHVWRFSNHRLEIWTAMHVRDVELPDQVEV